MISCIADGCFTAEPVGRPTNTRASSRKGGRSGEHPHIWRKGERLWSLPTPSFSPGLCPCPPPLRLIPLPLCYPLPNLSLSGPHSKGGRWSDFRPGPLTLAGGPRPSGAEASRAGTVKRAHCVVTAARPTGRWLLGTFIHVFFTCRASEASRAHTPERARQVLTDPSATQARALDTFIYICSEQGTQSYLLYAPPPILYSASPTSIALTFHPAPSCHPVPMPLLSILVTLPSCPSSSYFHLLSLYFFIPYEAACLLPRTLSF